MKDKTLEETLNTTVSSSSNNASEEKNVKNETSEDAEISHEEKVEVIKDWVDELFSKEQERLSKQGISSAKQWVQNMAAVDKAMADNPEATLDFLAKVYGVTLLNKNNNEQNINREIITCLQNLEHNQKILWKAFDTQNKQTQQLTISNFANAKDEEGNLLHPYFEIVKNDMFALISSGVVIDYESAYENALWLNPQTRSILLEKQEQDKLRALAEEADKAKTAGFSPQSGQEKEDFSQMTTREILERTIKKLEG